MSWVKDKEFMDWFESKGFPLVNMRAVYGAWVEQKRLGSAATTMVELSLLSAELGLPD